MKIKGVSVSLRSIIHSYLGKIFKLTFNNGSKVSVSLRSIIHSYYDIIGYSKNLGGFPSPYGVSFILIELLLELAREVYYYGFPSPYGVSFILI